MDGKKKTSWENFRAKAKAPFANMKLMKKTPGKKLKGRPLAYRRSISVPDLRFPPGEPSPSDSALPSTTSNVRFFAGSGQSDTDSVRSGPSFNDGLAETDSAPPIRSPAPGSPLRCTGAGDPRGAAPEPAALWEDEEEGEGEEEPISAFERSARAALERLSEDADGSKGADPPSGRAAVERSPSPKLTTGARGVTSSPEPQPSPPIEIRAGSAHRPLSSGDSFSSSGEQVHILQEKLASSGQRPRLQSDSGTPPASRAIRKTASDRLSVPLDRLTTPADRLALQEDRQSAPADRLALWLDRQTSVGSADGDSVCGSPLEEQTLSFWATDPEDQDTTDPLSSDITEMFRMDAQDELEEGLEQSDQYEPPALEQAGDSDTPGDAVPVALQRYLLTINLKEGRNLLIRDRSGSTDPYVKFKLGGKMLYKSKAVRKTSNPRWSESFSFPLRDRDHSVEVRVYDRNLTSDVFMGSSTLRLDNMELDRTCEMELVLDDPKCKVDNGVVVMETCLTLRDATIKRNPRWLPKRRRSFRGGQSNLNQVKEQRQAEAPARSQVWTGVFGVSLVEGQDMPHHGYGDIYVRFRLGEQKYRSKNLCIQANPQWREQFDFNKYEEVVEPLQVEVLAKRGRKCEECWGGIDIDLTRLPVEEKQLYTRMLDPGKGCLVLLVTLVPCWGVSVSSSAACPLDQPEERDLTLEKYSLKNTHKSIREVGFLQVQVLKASDIPSADLNGKSDPFCVVELGNSRLQTQTIYKTLNPEWNQVFTFPVKDIHDVLELTVFDENTDKSTSFLGKVAIPLLSIQSGQQVSCLLKKEDLDRPAKGTITLVLDVIYNPIRAGIKTFKPKETKFLEESPKFSKKVLAQNIYRVRKISTAVLYTLQYIKSCFQWESTQRSLMAFLMFVLTVWHWELFMLPLFLLLLVAWNYFQIATGRTSSNQDLVNMTMADEEEEDEKESSKKGLMDKIHMVHEIVITVQNILDEIASVGERIKNTFNWSVPFLSYLVCLVLLVATAALYYIPLRYIVLAWGVNKFTKKLRSPYAIDNNEMLDFLKRIPSDVQKVQYSEPRAPGVLGPAKRRR